MDIRSTQIEPTIEHGGTCRTYLMVPKESMRRETLGSYLEYVAEFELAPGSKLEPHYHDTDEFYYLLRGERPSKSVTTNANLDRETWCAFPGTPFTRSGRLTHPERSGPLVRG